MAPKFETVDAYIAALPAGPRQAAMALRKTIRAAAPDASESISYNIPAYRMNKAHVIYFGAWKSHVALYPVARGSGLEDRIAPFRSEKDTVRFDYAAPIPHDLVDAIVRARVDMIRRD